MVGVTALRLLLGQVLVQGVPFVPQELGRSRRSELSKKGPAGRGPGATRRVRAALHGGRSLRQSWFTTATLCAAPASRLSFVVLR